RLVLDRLGQLRRALARHQRRDRSGPAEQGPRAAARRDLPGRRRARGRGPAAGVGAAQLLASLSGPGGLLAQVSALTSARFATPIRPVTSRRRGTTAGAAAVRPGMRTRRDRRRSSATATDWSLPPTRAACTRAAAR